VQVHAVLYPLIENHLGVVGGVDILQLERLHPLVLMVEGCINNSVTDGLGDDLFSFFNTL
jgi:hypothetical protein